MQAVQRVITEIDDRRTVTTLQLRQIRRVVVGVQIEDGRGAHRAIGRIRIAQFVQTIEPVVLECRKVPGSVGRRRAQAVVSIGLRQRVDRRGGLIARGLFGQPVCGIVCEMSNAVRTVRTLRRAQGASVSRQRTEDGRVHSHRDAREVAGSVVSVLRHRAE